MSLRTRTPIALRRDESGSMLIELVIAMTFIVVAVGALMSSYASSMVSLHHSGTEGTALTLADRQIEAYKSLPYDAIQLAFVDHPERQRPLRDRPFERRHDPFLHRPDHGWHAGGVMHRVDPGCGRVRHADLDGARQPAVPGGHLHRLARRRPEGEPIKQITVAVRQMVSGSPGSKIWSRATSEFDQSNPPQ